MKKHLLSCTIAGLSLTCSNIYASDKPNIVYLLADDLGYGDISCLNATGKISTPNIDALGKAGMIFTDAHSAAAVCTPSRYGILTGRYPWRSPLKHGVLKIKGKKNATEAGCMIMIDEKTLTIGSFLKSQGYDTAAFGKWHLGLKYHFPEGKSISNNAAPVGTKIINGPITRGFDIFKGYHHAREMRTWIEQDKVTENLKSPEEMLEKITSAAINYLEEPQRKTKPFFLYIPFNSPHTPILPNSQWKGKSGINDYADYVMETDDAVGKITKAIKNAGLEKNTIIIFTSDNGCSHKANLEELKAAGHNPSYIFRGSKSDIWEGGHRIPFIIKWDGVVKAGTECKDPICQTSLLGTVADILNVKLPTTSGVDSFSIVKDLRNANNQDPTHSVIIHQSIKGNLSIRKGNWKFIAGNGSCGWTPGGDDSLFQLYNMRTDPEEQKNIYSSNPETISTLKAELENSVKEGYTVPGKSGQNDTPVKIYTIKRKKHKGRKRKKKN